MTRLPLRLILLLLLLLSAVALAAPPSTIGYQGRLATAGGQPISATLSITFRLYDSVSGGTALWNETQPAVDVDGGNLAVELGSVTALPDGIWGRQLYLGIQVAGDSEMAPRPALTAAPFARRAAATMDRTIMVSAVGTPAENGAALLAAVAGITDASATSPVAIEVDAGTFDLGIARIELPAYTSLSGRGRDATLILSNNTDATGIHLTAATVRLSSNTAVRDLTARHTGVPADPQFGVVGIAAFDPDVFQALLTNVRLERVSGESIGPPGSNGQRGGISLCVSDTRATDIVATAEGGLFAMALRSHCPLSTNVVVDGAELYADLASDGVRGAYLVSGRGNRWSRLQATIGIPTTSQTVYGIRFLAPEVFYTDGPEGVLEDSQIRLIGQSIAPTDSFRIEGVTLEDGAQLARIERTRVILKDVRGRAAYGINVLDRSSNTPSRAALNIVESEVRIEARQDDALGIADVIGIRLDGYSPQIERTRVQVECLAGSGYQCVGIKQPESWVPPSNDEPLLLAHSAVDARHMAPNASGSSSAVFLMGAGRIQQSTLRVVRSASAEPVTVVRLGSSSANLFLSQSSAIATDGSNSNSLCLNDGPPGASGELFGNHLQGIRCDGGQATLTCAGNTARGTGFLANTCP